MAVRGRMGGERELWLNLPPHTHTHTHQVYNNIMALNINHLGDVRAELFESRTKWYDIGLALKVPVTTLDSIEGQSGNDSKKLLETLKIWLKTAKEPSWQDVVGVLKSPVVGEPKLASDIEAKYCITAETGQASGPTMPEMQQAAIDQLQRQLQQVQQQIQQQAQQHQQVQHATEERERQVRELTEQLQQMKQLGPLSQKTAMQQQPLNMPLVGARLHETVTPPRPELRQPQEKQHAAANRQLQQMKRPGPSPQKTAMPQKAIRDMTWQKESKVPVKMYRGSAAVDANIAYFNGYGSTTVHSYDSDTQEWRRLPDAPHTQSTLVVVHHILTMVGGQVSERATDSLLSLMGEGRGGKWLPNLPAMPTKRYYTAAVCSGRSLIVAGGEDGSNRLATVEVLDTNTRQWSIASSLPHPFCLATISICGERLYMLGGYDDQSGILGTRSVLSCSIPELLQSCQPQPLAGKLRTAPANKSTIWRQVAVTPHILSSCALSNLCGQLVAVGGLDEAGESTTAITVYNETTDSWEAMGNMPTARRWALVAILNGKMMVVGGCVGGWWGVTVTDVVEILC